MIFVDGTVVNTALPAISRDLGATTAELQWVADGYILILAGLLLVGGTIGDRFGRRRWLAVGMAIFGLAAVGAALSTNVETLIAFRGLQGLGAALVMPATLSILTAVFPRGERAKAIGIWTAMGGLGAAFGPALGGYLVDEISWSAVFWLHIPIVGAALAGLAIVPESRDSRQLPLDVPGGILATGGLVALVFAIIQGNEAGWGSPEIVGAFALSIALLVSFAVVEARSAAPMLPLRFFRQRDFTGAVIVIGITFFALFGVFFFLTQFFQLVQGKSALEAGLLITPAALGLMVSAMLAGVLSRSVGPKLLAVFSMLLILAGMLVFTQLAVDSSVLFEVGAIFLFGFSIGLGEPPLTDTVMAAVPVDEAGIGSAVNDVSRELGGAFGVAVTGSVVNAVYRSNVESALEGVAPPEVMEATGEGIGVAQITAAGLPQELAATVTEAASTAFIDALDVGILVGVGLMVVATAVAALLLPWRMREQQAEAVEVPLSDEAAAATASEELAPAA